MRGAGGGARKARHPRIPPMPARPWMPPVLQAIVALGALIGSARALVVEWSSGFELFQ